MSKKTRNEKVLEQIHATNARRNNVKPEGTMGEQIAKALQLIREHEAETSKLDKMSPSVRKWLIDEIPWLLNQWSGNDETDYPGRLAKICTKLEEGHELTYNELQYVIYHIAQNNENFE